MTSTTTAQPDLAQLVRFGMNRTNETISVGANIFKDGTTTGHIVFGKNKRADASVPKRK